MPESHSGVSRPTPAPVRVASACPNRSLARESRDNTVPLGHPSRRPPRRCSGLPGNRGPPAPGIAPAVGRSLRAAPARTRPVRSDGRPGSPRPALHAPAAGPDPSWTARRPAGRPPAASRRRRPAAGSSPPWTPAPGMSPGTRPGHRADRATRSGKRRRPSAHAGPPAPRTPPRPTSPSPRGRGMVQELRVREVGDHPEMGDGAEPAQQFRIRRSSHHPSGLPMTSPRRSPTVRARRPTIPTFFQKSRNRRPNAHPTVSSPGSGRRPDCFYFETPSLNATAQPPSPRPSPRWGEGALIPAATVFPLGQGERRPLLPQREKVPKGRMGASDRTTATPLGSVGRADYR